MTERPSESGAVILPSPRPSPTGEGAGYGLTFSVGMSRILCAESKANSSLPALVILPSLSYSKCVVPVRWSVLWVRLPVRSQPQLRLTAQTDVTAFLAVSVCVSSLSVAICLFRRPYEANRALQENLSIRAMNCLLDLNLIRSFWLSKMVDLLS